RRLGEAYCFGRARLRWCAQHRNLRLVNELQVHVQTLTQGKQPLPGTAADGRAEVEAVRHWGSVKGGHEIGKKLRENGLSLRPRCKRSATQPRLKWPFPSGTVIE